MSEVGNLNSEAAPAQRPVMETVPDPMVPDASNGNPQATSGGTAGSTGVQAQGTDGVQGSTNVQGNVQGTSNVLQDFLDTPQANRLGTPQADC